MLRPFTIEQEAAEITKTIPLFSLFPYVQNWIDDRPQEYTRIYTLVHGRFLATGEIEEWIEQEKTKTTELSVANFVRVSGGARDNGALLLSDYYSGGGPG